MKYYIVNYENEIFQAVINLKKRKATVRPKRRFVPSDNSSQIPKGDKLSQASIRQPF